MKTEIWNNSPSITYPYTPCMYIDISVKLPGTSNWNIVKFIPEEGDSFEEITLKVLEKLKEYYEYFK
jgi:hypothetical protein